MTKDLKNRPDSLTDQRLPGINDAKIHIYYLNKHILIEFFLLIRHWTENGTPVSTNASYSFAVTGNRNLVAHFAIQSFEVGATASPEAGGAITGGGSYHYGESCTLTVTPNENYTFVSWTENGTVVSEETTYTFVVTENHRFIANLTYFDGIGEATGGEFTIHPNPADDILFIESDDEFSRCEIYASTGRLVYRNNHRQSKLTVLYLCQKKSRVHRQSQQLVIPSDIVVAKF